MRKLDKFLISRRPYAARIGSLRTGRETRPDGTPFWLATVDAVWFRRKTGTLVACLGHLWDYQEVEPTTVEEFLTRHNDGRYGGTAMGRWDGANYWGNGVTYKISAQHLRLLRPMLASYPNVPPGFDGWWTFHANKTEGVLNR